MSVMPMERIEAELRELRKLVEARVGEPEEKLLFKIPEAAKRLGISLTRMRALIDCQVVSTVQLDSQSHKMVPRSELLRLAHAEPPKMVSPKGARLMQSVAKLREPIPGARDAAVTVRAAKRPRPNQSLEALQELMASKKRKPKG